jgi:hypothetical protein
MAVVSGIERFPQDFKKAVTPAPPLYVMQNAEGEKV